MLEYFPVNEAQHLQRGDLIARLDPRDYQSALASAKAQFDNAEKEYQRTARLAKKNTVSRHELEQKKAGIGHQSTTGASRKST